MQISSQIYCFTLQCVNNYNTFFVKIKLKYKLYIVNVFHISQKHKIPAVNFTTAGNLIKLSSRVLFCFYDFDNVKDHRGQQVSSN